MAAKESEDARAAASPPPDPWVVERAERLAFFRAAAHVTPIVAAPTRAGTFLVSTADDVIGRSLFVKRTRGELRTLRLALAALEAIGLDPRADGRAFVDVGANIGTTCIPALLRHGFARAIAVEPGPENHRVLRANLALNGLEERVTTCEVAVSDGDGEARLALCADNWGDHRLALDGAPAPGLGERLEVRVTRTTLDGLLERIGLAPAQVGLLWVDAQGHEAHILAGAGQLLAAGVPAVVELWPSALAAGGGLERLLGLLGARYTHVVDLDEPGGGSLVAIAELPAIAERRAEGVTDVLVVRRP